MRLKAYREYEISYHWPPHVHADKDSVTILYDPQGLPAGHVDKFFVSPWWKPPTEFAASAVLAATNSDPNATTITLRKGLVSGRKRYVLGIRYDANNQPTGTYSNVEVVGGRHFHIDTVPPRCQLVSDWSREGLYDWLFTSEMADLLAGQPYVDPIHGPFISIRNRGDYPRAGASHSVGVPAWEGIHKISPRYDFRFEIKWRHHDQWMESQQTAIGIVSNGQNMYWHEVWRFHGTQAMMGPDTTVPYINLHAGKDPEAHLSWAAEWGGTWATIDLFNQGITDFKDLSQWRIAASRNHPKYNDWHFHTGYDWLTGQPSGEAEIATTKLIYSAADKTVQLWKNNVLLQTIGNHLPEAPMSTRKRFPVNHYPFPVVLLLRSQGYASLLGPGGLGAGLNDEVHTDLFEVKITSDCPYEYGGFSMMYAHHLNTYGALFDGDHEFYPRTEHTLDRFTFYLNWNAKRYSASDWCGVTVPRQGHVWSTQMMPYETHTFPPQAPDELVTGYTPPVAITPGRKVRFCDFQGLRIAANTVLKCRLIDENLQPIMDWVNVNAVFDNPMIPVPPNNASSVRCEIAMAYYGGEIPFRGYSASPNYPVMFYGFGVYAQGTVAKRAGNTITIEAWDDADVFYRWGYAEDVVGEYEPYLAALTIPDEAETLYFYGAEPGYTEQERALSLVTPDSTLFTSIGTADLINASGGRPELYSADGTRIH